MNKNCNCNEFCERSVKNAYTEYWFPVIPGVETVCKMTENEQFGMKKNIIHGSINLIEKISSLCPDITEEQHVDVYVKPPKPIEYITLNLQVSQNNSDDFLCIKYAPEII